MDQRLHPRQRDRRGQRPEHTLPQPRELSGQRRRWRNPGSRHRPARRLRRPLLDRLPRALRHLRRRLHPVRRDDPLHPPTTGRLATTSATSRCRIELDRVVEVAGSAGGSRSGTSGWVVAGGDGGLQVAALVQVATSDARANRSSTAGWAASRGGYPGPGSTVTLPNRTTSWQCEQVTLTSSS